MPLNIPFGGSPAQLQQAKDHIYLRGGVKKPEPPVDIIAQAGPLKVNLSWRIPSGSRNILATRIYLDTENNRIAELPAGVTSASIALGEGQTRGIFLSLVSPSGLESRKVQRVCSSKAANLPDPLPPGAERAQGMEAAAVVIAFRARLVWLPMAGQFPSLA